MVSFDQFPNDSGAVPGKWRLALRDEVNDSFCGTSFIGGVSQEPVSGFTARRLSACTSVLGAMRVDGEGECELGDCSRLRPPPAPDQPSAQTAPSLVESAPEAGDEDVAEGQSESDEPPSDEDGTRPTKRKGRK